MFADLRNRNCCEGVDLGPHLQNEWMKGAFRAVTGSSNFQTTSFALKNIGIIHMLRNKFKVHY